MQATETGSKTYEGKQLSSEIYEGKQVQLSSTVFDLFQYFYDQVQHQVDIAHTLVSPIKEDAQYLAHLCPFADCS